VAQIDVSAKAEYIGCVTRIEISDGRLKIEILGWDKLWSFKSRLEFPAEHIAGARAWDKTRDSGWKGLRAPGTALPGVILAGTYHWNGEHVFYDVHNFDNAIIIELHDEWYTRVVIEVEDSEAALTYLKSVSDRCRG
jgi:hypothetical protein